MIKESFTNCPDLKDLIPWSVWTNLVGHVFIQLTQYNDVVASMHVL